MSDRHHFLILTYPAHSHINPVVQLAHRLLHLGVKVTLATTPSACRRVISQNDNLKNLDFVELPENFTECFGPEEHEEEEKRSFKLGIKQNCSAILAKVVFTSNENGWPVTCSVYTPTVPWTINVVEQLPIPSVMLWTQPAAVLVIFYYFFFGYRDTMIDSFETKNSIELPGLPYSLKARDLPTFMWPGNSYPWALKLFESQTNWIAAKGNNNVLINTFESLEPEALKAVKELKMIPIGPLLTLQSDNIKTRSDTENYVQWLDSKADRSVVYVSFGSLWHLSTDQVQEIARALLDVGRPFVWILRPPGKQSHETEANHNVTQIDCFKDLKQLGLIIPWCIQTEVLSHKSIGCFVTHCGWNSTLESLAAGVPMVGIPLHVEQVTNAKLIDEYWKCGVRACGDDNDLVVRDEIRRCLELVMGDEGMRQRAGKWKELAAGAAVRNGPVDVNLRCLLKELEKSE